ncbi:intradiol ring-cleavage dioxygenase [Plantactinospora sp. KBS50]|uniref:intradiol ring-cleavage dioxygenase n=1 Tax=Plantactinospora sp. KBS50 TaxID=2024580 RepID=UPI000BAAA07E|nr:intradiol ring-cleavage dioxygenase [Plantactinospora sp. KBS50]ASW54509.1 3,4-dioxygenase subunit beta [Plantactinospora sp. KBS50]
MSSRSFDGRPLPRPDAELVDQGLGFDLGTLTGRRQILRALGLGAVALGTAACGGTSSGSTASAGGTSAAGAAGTTEIPDETAGPYPGDGSNGPDVLEQSGIVRSDIRSSFGTASGTAEGVPMTLELTILDMANGNAPFAGVAVYVWQCDRGGLYSLYSQGVTEQNYLRGVQVADASGRVRFTSIFPGCYEGRWPHVHFEVYPDQASITESTNAIATSQVALPAETCHTVYAQSGYEKSVDTMSRVTLEDDNVFGDDDGVNQLGAVTGDVTAGYAVSLTVPVDTRTAPTGGNAPNDQGGGPGGQGGTPPSGGPGGGTPPSGGPGGGTPPSGGPGGSPA